MDHVHLKGPPFTGPDDPTLPHDVLALDREARDAWWDDYVDRWQVVEICPTCGADLIEEERIAHRHKHYGPAARIIVRILQDMAPAERVDAIRDFCSACGCYLPVESHREDCHGR